MLNKLRELIFGLNASEKTRIEDRYFLAKEILNSLKIKKLEDFEILEDIIYKIKEELRLKSSNLNKTIKSSKRDFKRSNVNDLFEELNKLKYDFLNKAFSIIENDLEQEEIIQNNSNQIKEEPTLDLEDINSEISDNKILENEDFILTLENGKVQHFQIDFKEEINFKYIKLFSGILFEELKAQGTNIIIDGKKVLIIPRFNEDNLISLPRIQIDIENIFEKIQEKISKTKPDQIKEKEKEDFVEISNLEEDKNRTPSLKSKEDSLDSLLSEIENYKEVSKNLKPKPKEDQSKPQIIKDDKIQIEKKEEIIKDSEIETIKESLTKKYEIYRDDKIVAYLEKNSKIIGELIIQSIEEKKISNLDEGVLAYISIFSKVFSSILFETLKAQGTNLIYDMNDNKIRIIPRFEKDNLNNLKWDTKSNTNEFLEQVKNKLILAMSKELNKDETDKESTEKKKEKPQENSKELEDKANYILDSLRKIP